MGKWFFNCCFFRWICSCKIFFSLSREINKLLSFPTIISYRVHKLHLSVLPGKAALSMPLLYISMNLWCCRHFMIYMEKLFYRCSIWTLPCILIIPYGSRRYSQHRRRICASGCVQSTKKCLLIFIWFSTWFNLACLEGKIADCNSSERE